MPSIDHMTIQEIEILLQALEIDIMSDEPGPEMEKKKTVLAKLISIHQEKKNEKVN